MPSLLLACSSRFALAVGPGLADLEFWKQARKNEVNHIVRIRILHTTLRSLFHIYRTQETKTLARIQQSLCHAHHMLTRLSADAQRSHMQSRPHSCR